MNIKFPRGLLQPSTGYRFAVDSILLACFVETRDNEKLLDLGCGCGVISFGILLRQSKRKLHITGVERVEEVAEMARENARRLGVLPFFKVICNDVREIIKGSVLRPESFDRIVCNPPYRRKDSGRLSPHDLKNLARFQGETTLEDFIKTGAYYVKNRGKLYCSYISEGIVHLFSTLRKFRMEPKRIRFVHGHINNPSRIVLVETVKNGNPGLIVEPPLILYKGEKTNIYEDEALTFCPFLK